MNDVWPTSTVSAATARRPSTSGKRGLPGGGRRASGAASGTGVPGLSSTSIGGRVYACAVPYPLRRVLPVIALLALAVRVAYILLNGDFPVSGDALAFHLEGGFLAHGEGFRRAFEDVPTAEYPPLHTVVIAFTDLLGLHGTQGQKLFFASVGTVTVVLIALLARAVTRSDRVGIIAGVLAALYPMLWLPDGALMAETTYGVFVTGTLLAAVAMIRRPTV